MKNKNNEEFVILFQQYAQARGFYKGKIDGWAGELTTEAFDKMQALLGLNIQEAKTTSPVSKREQLMKVVEGYRGLHESSPTVSRMISEAANWLDSDGTKTAWCGCFAGHCMLLAGLKPPLEYYRARHFVEVGERILPTLAKPGDIVVFTNHVTFFESWVDPSATRANCIGGNQNNMVKTSVYNLLASNFLGIYRV